MSDALGGRRETIRSQVISHESLNEAALMKLAELASDHLFGVVIVSALALALAAPFQSQSCYAPVSQFELAS